MSSVWYGSFNARSGGAEPRERSSGEISGTWICFAFRSPGVLSVVAAGEICGAHFFILLLFRWLINR